MYCEHCKKVLPVNSVFCPYCGAMSRKDPLAQQTSEATTQESAANQIPQMPPSTQMPPMQPQPFQQIPQFEAQTSAWQQPQEKKKTPTWVIVTIVLAVAAVLAACTFIGAFAIETIRNNEPRTSLGGGSASLDSDWDWTEETHPREDEILNHLSEKYGEEFRIDFYSPEWSDGIAHITPVRDRNLFFAIQYADEGRELDTDEMRDDYLLVLAGDFAEDKVWSIIEEHFGSREIDHFRVSYSAFDPNASFSSRWSMADSFPPADFMWDPADGLDALFNSLDMEISLSVSVSLRSQDLFDEISQDDVRAIAEEITTLGVVSTDAFISIDSPASFSLDSSLDDGWIWFDWEVRDGEIFGGQFSR